MQRLRPWRAMKARQINNRKTPWQAAVAGLMLLSAICGGCCYQSFDRAMQSLHWSPIRAVIGRSWSEEHRSHSSVTTSLIVPYSFSVSGSQYFGRLPVRYVATLGDAAMKQLPEGKPIIVFYDPSHPDQSAVAKGYDGESALFGIRLAIYLFMIGLTVLAWDAFAHPKN